jgi:hypothetical protein
VTDDNDDVVDDDVDDDDGGANDDDDDDDDKDEDEDEDEDDASSTELRPLTTEGKLGCRWGAIHANGMLFQGARGPCLLAIVSTVACETPWGHLEANDFSRHFDEFCVEPGAIRTVYHRPQRVKNDSQMCARVVCLFFTLPCQSKSPPGHLVTNHGVHLHFRGRCLLHLVFVYRLQNQPSRALHHHDLADQNIAHRSCKEV